MARKSRKPQGIADEAALVSVKPKYSAAIYTRLSVEDNNIDDGNSIETQKEMLLNYVEARDDMSLYGVYCDNGFTGSNFERDDFIRMMDDIKNSKVNAIVVKDLSRFGRNYIETGNYVEKILPFMGVRFVSVNDGYDSCHNSPGDILLTLRNIVNHAYVSDISRKIKTMFETKQNNGDFIGWAAPYGYLKSEDNNNKLVIDPECAPLVKEIFEWKAQGLGFMAIARKLNEMEIPSPRMRNIAMGRYKTAPTNGRFWTDMSVKIIVKNPVYAGHMAQRKYTRTAVNGKQKQLSRDDMVIVRDTHEPIVSDELWEAAQAATQKNIERLGITFRPHRANKGENLLKGILYCPHCNKAMQYRMYDSHGKKYSYYFCGSRRVNPNCTSPRIKEDVIVGVIFSVIKKEIAIAADVRKVLEKASKSRSYADNMNRLQAAVRDANMRIKRTNALKTRLFDTFGDGLIAEAEFKEMKDGYAEEAERLQTEVEALEQEQARLSGLFSKDNERIAAFLKFNKQKALTREMFTELVEKIIVNGPDDIEIVWRFADEYRAVLELAKAGDGL